MKLTIFQSEKGDCLLLESSDGKRILCDGGMRPSMQSVVRQELAKLRPATLDYVYISHIDQDHIAGIVQLLEDAIDWRLYDHHKAAGTPIAKPKVPRPPAIGGIWHNAFRDQVGENADKVEDLLAASAPSLLASGDVNIARLGAEYQQIAQSIPEAIKVSQFTSAKLLGIPVNQLPGANGPAKLMMIRRNQPAIPVGSMNLTIVGPSSKELEQLKKGWNNWLSSSENQESLARTRRQIRDKIEGFSNLETFDRPWNGVMPFKGVTTPNIASLMFMVEENGKRILLTGDSQQDIILAGLEATGFLTQGSVHLDVLKMQHHGSEHNLDANFAKHVSADNYIFTGNGMNGNPELSVLDLVFQSRMGKPTVRTLAPQAGNRPFHFWFSTTADAQRQGSAEQKVYAAVEKHVAGLVAQSGGRLTATFNKGAGTTLTI